MTTKIEWCQETWNPVTGCTKISEGCHNCYAERMAKRLAGRYGYPKDEPFKPGIFHQDKINLPLSWKHQKKVFVCSMGDIFHDDVDIDHQIKIFDRISQAKNITFMILTKRPENALRFCIQCGLIPSGLPLPACPTPSGVEWPKNAWLGVTAENQQRADERIPILLSIPAAVRFVSVEPMLGKIDFRKWLPHHENCRCPECYHRAFKSKPAYTLDWVICGGESGPCARPMHPDWALSLRDQCVAAGVPFFFKQWGEWGPRDCFSKCVEVDPDDKKWPSVKINKNGFNVSTDLDIAGVPGCGFDDHAVWMQKCGKKISGNLLGGQEWNQYPNY